MLQDLALFKSYTRLLEVLKQWQVITTQPMMQPKLGFVALPGDEARGGSPGTKHRVVVSFVDENLSPSRVLRHNLDGFEDIDSGDVPTCVESEPFKKKI